MGITSYKSQSFSSVNTLSILNLQPQNPRNSQDDLLFSRVYKRVCAIWGSDVLLSTDVKNVAMSQSMMKGVNMEWRKNQELFSLEVNHQ
jgi:hypothetical protein